MLFKSSIAKKLSSVTFWLFKKDIIFLEIGKNLFSKEALDKYIENNIKIYRLDVTQGFSELIEQKINTKDEVYNHKVKKKLFNFKKKNKQKTILENYAY